MKTLVLSTYLNLDTRPNSAYVVVTGSSSDLDSLEHTLSVSFSQRLWVRKDTTTLAVLTGALLHLGWLPAQDMSEVDERIGFRAHKLEAAGLLREYQRRAVTSLLYAPLGRGIGKLACGSGKTRVALALCACHGGDWLYLAPSRQLVDQTEKETGTLLNQMLAHTDTGATLTCNSFTSVTRDELQACDGLIIDECHRVGARTYSQNMVKTTARLRLGLSGTPLDRSDDKNELVIGLLGPIRYSISQLELTRLGFLSPARLVCL